MPPRFAYLIDIETLYMKRAVYDPDRVPHSTVQLSNPELRNQGSCFIVAKSWFARAGDSTYVSLHPHYYYYYFIILSNAC